MKGIHLPSLPLVILSGASASRSEALAQSKDPYRSSVILSETYFVSRRTYAISRALLIACTLLLASLASAQTLTGTVKNSTTGKPAAGDDVVLLSLGQGMEEAGRTKSDAKGNFSFKLDAAGPTPHPRDPSGSHLSPHGASGNHIG